VLLDDQGSIFDVRVGDRYSGSIKMVCCLSEDSRFDIGANINGLYPERAEG
jgi:hypothetical protein